MARGSGKFDEILDSIVGRIRSEIDGANEATCYLCLNPDAIPSPSPGAFAYIVSPTGGEFDDTLFDGGGQDQCTVNGGVIVKIHSTVILDQAKRDAIWLTDSSLGVITQWRRVLKALAGYSPLNNAGNEHTRNPLIPHAYVITRSDKLIGAIEQTFQLTYDWDLS